MKDCEYERLRDFAADPSDPEAIVEEAIQRLEANTERTSSEGQARAAGALAKVAATQRVLDKKLANGSNGKH